jgi:hypothetical protein
MPAHDANGQMNAKVSLHPAIQLEPCSTYFMTSQWLGAKPALEARQRLLRKVHDEVVRAIGGGKVIAGWRDLKDAPAEVTVLGAPIEETKKYVDRTLAQLGKAPNGELLFSTTRCPPGATCRPTEDVHWVSYEFKLMRAGRPWVVHEHVDGVDVCLEVRIALEIETRMQHQPGGTHEHAGAAGTC